MSLLEEIREKALDPTTNISNLLRECKVLAAKLGHSEFNSWVDSEMGGYGSIDSLPTYRVLSVESIGDFVGPFGSGYKNVPIPPSALPEKFRDIATKAFLIEPASYYLAFLSDDTQQQSGILTSPWPADILPLLTNKVYPQMGCIYARRQIPTNSIAAMIDTIQNRILSFVLELESEFPDSIEKLPEGKSEIRGTVSKVFNTIILGNVGQVYADSPTINIQDNLIVNNHDFDSLRTFLSSVGFEDGDIDDLEQSLKKDGDDSKNIGEHTGNWIGKMISQAKTKLSDISSSTVANLVTRAISNYLGLDG